MNKYCNYCGTKLKERSRKPNYHPETGELTGYWIDYECPINNFWKRIIGKGCKCEFGGYHITDYKNKT